MLIKASVKSVQMSPRKVGVVATLVRGRSIADAIAILEHTPRSASTPVKKLLKSAEANALNNHGLTGESLVLKSISVTPGSRLKRYRPAARGRALPYQKKSSHIYVEVSGEKKQPKKPAAKTAKERANA